MNNQTSLNDGDPRKNKPLVQTGSGERGKFREDIPLVKNDRANVNDERSVRASNDEYNLYLRGDYSCARRNRTKSKDTLSRQLENCTFRVSFV